MIDADLFNSNRWVALENVPSHDDINQYNHTFSFFQRCVEGTEFTSDRKCHSYHEYKETFALIQSIH